MKTYEIFSGEELKIAEKIQQRRLQMLVHSRIYYKENQNLISDREWDMYAKELLKLQTDYPYISKQVDWYDAFKDWDASTGEFLPLENEWVIKKAKQLLGIGSISVKKPLVDTQKSNKTTSLLNRVSKISKASTSTSDIKTSTKKRTKLF